MPTTGVNIHKGHLIAWGKDTTQQFTCNLHAVSITHVFSRPQWHHQHTNTYLIITSRQFQKEKWKYDLANAIDPELFNTIGNTLAQGFSFAKDWLKFKIPFIFCKKRIYTLRVCYRLLFITHLLRQAFRLITSLSYGIKFFSGFDPFKTFSQLLTARKTCLFIKKGWALWWNHDTYWTSDIICIKLIDLANS